MLFCGVCEIFNRKPKLSRHFKLNNTNISLLLREAIQKYRKLTDYWEKILFSLCLSLCLRRLVLTAAFLNGILNVTSDHSYRINFRFLDENRFLQVKPARCHCLHKKSCVYNNFNLRCFMSSVITQRLHKSFSFINSSAQI